MDLVIYQVSHNWNSTGFQIGEKLRNKVNIEVDHRVWGYVKSPVHAQVGSLVWRYLMLEIE